MTDDIVVRPSSLVDYLDCSRRWAARHLRDMLAAAGYEVRGRGTASAGALVGSGVHAGAAWTLEQMRDGSGPGTEAEAIDAAITGLHERIAAEGAEWDDTTDRPNTAEKQVARMTKVFRREVAPQITPILVEKRVEAEIAPGWILSGQLDTLASDRDAPEQVVRDTKTGTRARANGVQYGAYSLLFAAHGYAPGKILEDYIPRVKLSAEQPSARTAAIDVATARMDAHEALQGIMRDTAEFQRRAADPRGLPPPGAFKPNPGSQLCSARWCPAFGTTWCKSHRA